MKSEKSHTRKESSCIQNSSNIEKSISSFVKQNSIPVSQRNTKKYKNLFFGEVWWLKKYGLIRQSQNTTVLLDAELIRSQCSRMEKNAHRFH